MTFNYDDAVQEANSRLEKACDKFYNQENAPEEIAKDVCCHMLRQAVLERSAQDNVTILLLLNPDIVDKFK